MRCFSTRGRVNRLPTHQKLLDLPPLAFDFSRLLLLHRIMQLELLAGLCRLADPSVAPRQPIMSIHELWLRCDCLCVRVNRLLKIAPGVVENPKLQVSFTAFGIDRHSFVEQSLHMEIGRESCRERV